MSKAVHVAALVLMLVQGIGLCACRLDASHLVCLADHGENRTCPTPDGGGPLDGDCNAHQPQLREARSDGSEPVDLVAVPTPAFGLLRASADAAPSIRPTDSTAPPPRVGRAVSLPRLN